MNEGIVEAVAEGAEGSVRLVSSGHSAPDQEVVITDPEAKAEQLPGHVGEVWVRGPSVAQGYWGREDATRETFGAYLADGRGPFMRTGDLGCFHTGADGKAAIRIVRISKLLRRPMRG